MKTVKAYHISIIMNNLEQAGRALSNMPSSPLRDLAYQYVDEAAAKMRWAFVSDVQIEERRECT